MLIVSVSDDEKLASYSRSTMSKTAGEVRVAVSRRTCTSLNRQGNFMSFTFNGTAVYVYGSKRRNHGVYSGERDGRHYSRYPVATLTARQPVLTEPSQSCSQAKPHHRENSRSFCFRRWTWIRTASTSFR